MLINFQKYHGAGNDFIIINDLQAVTPLSKEQIALICHRNYGIGADGLIQITHSDQCDFKMIYYNSDGLIGSMCGNGGRSAAAFAFREGIAKKKHSFEAYDGIHQAEIIENKDDSFIIKLSMKDVDSFDINENRLIVDTGSPHYITKAVNLSEIDVVSLGRKIRHDKSIAANGINVNFIEVIDSEIHLRTYERGVENETLSCGTGVTATAIAAKLWYNIDSPVIYTFGGKMQVQLQEIDSKFVNINLIGPVQAVFSGKIRI